MAQTFTVPDDLPPDLPWHTDDDIRSAWSVIWDRRERIHEVMQAKFPEVPVDRLRKMVDGTLDLLILSTESFGFIADQWRAMDRDGTIERLMEADGKVV